MAPRFDSLTSRKTFLTPLKRIPAIAAEISVAPCPCRLYFGATANVKTSASSAASLPIKNPVSSPPLSLTSASGPLHSGDRSQESEVNAPAWGDSRKISRTASASPSANGRIRQGRMVSSGTARRTLPENFGIRPAHILRVETQRIRQMSIESALAADSSNRRRQDDGARLHALAGCGAALPGFRGRQLLRV